MRTKTIILGSVFASALAVTACSDEPEQPIATETAVEIDEMAMPAEEMDGDMTGEMDAASMEEVSYDAGGQDMRVPTMQDTPNYDRMRTQPLNEEQQTRRDAMNSADAERDTNTAARDMAESGEPLRDAATDGDASFSQLDRDDSGMLTPAEFAVYDLSGINPQMQGNKEDEQRPYVSTEALNMAMDDFVRLDTNGDGKLSREEFEAVRT